MRTFLVIGVTVGALVTVAGCGSRGTPAAGEAKPNFTFMTNGVGPFWEIAQAGVEAARDELGVDVTVIMPNGLADQTRKIEDLLVRGTNGIAISPIDPENQVEILNEAAAETNLITHDSDALQTNRRLYIGMNNYDAGIMCGRALREALPDGGNVMIFVGRVDQDNGKRRRQGSIDGFLGREPDPTRNDPIGNELTSDDGKYTVLGTMIDGFDRAKGKSQAEDTLTRHPDISGMMGLFEFNPPLIMEALERAGKLGKVKVIGFDENPVTLQGIKDGTVIATIVQNPYQYGYKSIQLLNELHKGNKSVIPENQFVDIPARVITTANVDDFWQELKDREAK